MTLKIILDGASCAKATHRSTSVVGQTQAPSAGRVLKGGNSISNARRDGAEDHRNKVKFLEAMKNPNWRDRGSCNSTFVPSSTGDSAVSEMADGGRTKPRARGWALCDPVRVEPDNISNRKISASDRLLNARQEADAAACRDGFVSLPQQTGGTTEPAALCDVIRRKTLDISHSGGGGLQVFELTPHQATGMGNVEEDTDSLGHAPKFAMIQRLGMTPTEAPARIRNHIHSYQLPTVLYLQNHERERCRARLGTNEHSEASQTLHLLQGPVLGKNQGLLPSEDLEALFGPHAEHEARSTPGRGSQGEDGGADVGDEKQKNTKLGTKNTAFQKMLDKLRRSTAASQPGREVRDSGYVTGSGSDVISEEPLTIRAPGSSKIPPSGQPADKRVRREKTASDPVVSHRRENTGSSHQTERSKDAGISDDGSVKLNPKAREFLSFMPDGQAALATTASKQHYLPLSERSGSEHSGNGSAADVCTEPPADGAPQCEPAPFVYGPAAPLFASDMAAGPDLRAVMAPCLGLADAFGTATWPPRLGNYLEQAQLTASWLSGANNMFARPDTALCAAPGGPGGPAMFHSLPGRFPGPVTPLPVPLVSPPPPPPPPPHAGSFGRPAPVAKPKVPNAWDQQAYEAYIEQRKAMEPGYAMECRLRQQRRAKRPRVSSRRPV